MVWYKGAGSVAPDDVEGFPPERRGLSGWIKRHPVVSAVTITLLILGIVAAIVVPVTCSVHGCPPKKEQQTTIDPLYDGAPLRLVVAFLADVDVNDLVPPILKPYTARVKMALSNLQILEAQTESVLNLILNELAKRTDIDLLVRDFVLRGPTVIDNAVSSGSSTGRRILQTPQAGYALNDSGLSDPSAWWFNRINVTGAWQLLGINSSSPSTQTSDVIIAVTDSGAWVDHPDLQTTWWNNPAEVDSDRADNDNNTFIDDFYGACFSTSACSPTYSGNNVAGCGIGANTSAWNGITDRISHGTKIAGIIGATPNNLIGLAGVAPNLRQMILKVTDETWDPVNPPYAYSDVVRAVDYAYGKGARIFSMSFGPNGKYSFNSANKPAIDAAAAAYRSLFTKYSDALFVAAAGNEWVSLEDWRASNFTYAPCMVNTANSLCVGGTNSSDAIFYANLFNRDVGTNYGPTTVDMGAPAYILYTTDLSYNGVYSSPSGTSFSTPMVAAVAGLVLSALGGQTRATSQTPAVIKDILMQTGDVLPSLQNRFRSARRLNAGNAVAAGLVYAAQNRRVVRAARNLTDIDPSMSMQAWEYYWWRKPQPEPVLEPFGLTFGDYHIRNSANTNINVFRYGTGTLLMATTWLRIDTAGLYSIQVRTSLAPEKWRLLVGEMALVWNMTANNTVGYVDLIFPQTGWYNMTLWANPESTPLNFLWLTPGSAIWSSPNFCWTVHEDPPSSRYYDPGMQPKPAMWHVVWNESNFYDDFQPYGNRAFFVMNKDPLNYRMQQTLVTDFNFATPIDLRNALYGVGNVPANNMSVVYGYARANLRALNYSQTVIFRLQGQNTRLFINDQNTIDFQDDVRFQQVSPCITLKNNTAHEIFFYFAVRFNQTNPVSLTWTTCTGGVAPAVTATSWTSLTPSIATNYFWQVASKDLPTLPRGFRCDAWPTNRSVMQVGTTPAFNTTPPTLTWMFPRDCPASYRNPNGECRMETRLIDLFPFLTWPNWSIRCYTYWASSPTRGLTGAQILGGPIYQHLAGVKTYEQRGNGVSYVNYSPLNTRFPTGLYQLYVIEWIALAQQWNTLASQLIWNGIERYGGTNDVLASDNSTMILPAFAVAPFAGRDVTSA